MSWQLLAGRYRLLSVLGRGGMATVWRGVDERLGRPVAVKILDRVDTADQASRERFDREARTAARLTHPNVVAVHDVGVDEGLPYLVMELVDGSSIATRLAGGPLPVDEAVRIAGQVCQALAAAHAHGVVHRDIKPENVLLTEAGTVKVCDFGIARLTHQQQADLTGPAMAIGTSGYMAPEQATGGPVAGYTDLYALGCLLYAMLTGNPPFTGDDPLAVLWQHQQLPAPPVRSHRPDVPADLDRLVGQLLAKNPGDRPAHAMQVRDVLARIAGALPMSTPTAVSAVLSPTRTLPVPDSQYAPPTSRGRIRLGPAGIAAVAAGAAVLAALAAILLLSRAPTTDAGSAGASNQPGVASNQPGVASSPPGAATSPPGATSSPPSAASTDGQTGPPDDDPIGQVAALRATVDEQAQAGQLDPKAADDLIDKIDDVEKELAKGRADKAAEKLADVRGKLDDLRKDEEISLAGYTALHGSLTQLAGVLPLAQDEDGGG